MKNNILFFAFLFLSAIFLNGQEFPKQVDSIVKSHFDEDPNIAISVGFIDNNKTHYTSYGKRSRESTIAIDENTIFEIASITKILTANLTAQAVLENKIKIDDFIDDYLPPAYKLQKDLKNKIKISDLASHQSGLPDIDFGKLISLNPQQPVRSVDEHMLETLINDCEELSDYGSYRYSTMGYILLGQILEQVYEKSYDEILSEKLLTPLEMNQTITLDSNIDNKTTGYNPEGGVQEFFEWNITGPAGLVKSNAVEMLKFLKSVMNEDNNIAKAAIFSEKSYYKKEGREMGLGLNIVKDAGNTIYVKTGDSMGQSSIMGYNRKKNRGLVILINQRNPKLRQQLFNAIYESVLK